MAIDCFICKHKKKTCKILPLKKLLVQGQKLFQQVEEEMLPNNVSVFRDLKRIDNDLL